MIKKQISMLLLISFLLLAFCQLSRGEILPAQTTVAGWQVENQGGYYSESNGVFQLGTNGGADNPGVGLYKEIHPTGDFNFSLQVKANVNESCALVIRGSLPIHRGPLPYFGVNFEYGHYGAPVFLFARPCENQIWTLSQVAYSSAIEWYTMQLTVYSSPFRIQVSVLDENGTLLGTYSSSDITNFGFKDIKYIGFYAWGYSPGDYQFRNIENPFDKPASISINTLSASTIAGSAVNVFGKLSDSNNTALENKTIILSYTFQGLNSWVPISSGQTDELGNYNIQWINSASGTFTLKTEWSGDTSNAYASNTTTLNFLPIENKCTFIIESNSTVNELTFNNNTSTLSFNVTGPSETRGYVKATIAKSLLADGEGLQAYIDRKTLNYTVTSTEDSWIYTFNYSHSTHQINMHINANSPVAKTSQTQSQGSNILLIGLIILFGTILSIATISLLRFRRLPSQSVD